MMNRCIPILVVALMVALDLGCGDAVPPSEGATNPAATLTRPTVREPDPSVFQASGPIVVENQVDVAAQREGLVSQILVDIGTPVRKGQLLATLDNRQLQADHDAAEAKLRSIAADVKNWEAEVKVLQADLERAQKMWDAQLITKEVFDHTRYKLVADQYELEREQRNYDNQLAVMRSLDLELEKTRIAAPFDGVVARRYVRAGQKIAMGDRLFWVTAVSPLEVKFTLPEKFLGKVKKGQLITVVAAQTNQLKHMARIVQISPVVDPASGTIEVMAQVTGAVQDLHPGMTANIQLENPR